MEIQALCPICNSSDARRTRHRAGDTRVAQCQLCGFLYTIPRPHELALAKYYQDLDDAILLNRLILMSQNNPIYTNGIRQISRYVETGSVLDVGCSFGGFLVEARKVGYQVTGVDPSPVACSCAQESQGLNVLNMLFEQSAFASESFEIVTFWEVLEHMASPRQVLQEAYRILKPGGLLVVRVPNAAFQVMKSIIPGVSFHIGSHLNHFTRATLERLLEEEHFQIQQMQAGVADLRNPFLLCIMRKTYAYLAGKWARFVGPEVGNILVAFARKPSS